MRLVDYTSKSKQKVEIANPAWMHWSALICSMLLIANALTYYVKEHALVVSDITCGVLIAGLTVLGLSGRRIWIRWPMAFIASWLFFAPLILRAKSPVAYEGATLIAILLIVLYWIIPSAREKSSTAAEVPPKWSYNPSAWSQRIPLIGLALLGFFISRYLAAYQLGYSDTTWDPVFKDGTEKVLSSDISKAFVISDAGLGAVSYIVDAVAGAIGGKNRWQTMPWMVLLFSILVIPPGIVSIVLVMLQPLGVGTWCSLCLLASIAMLFMVPLAFDETLATVQYLARAKAAGHSVWKTILRGTDVYADVQEHPIPEASYRAPSNIPPINLALTTLSACWLMAAPHFTSTTGSAAAHSIFFGAIAATIAVMAYAEVLRPVRFLNILVGLWVVASCFILTGYSQLGYFSALLSGLLLILLSVPKGRIDASYESWNRFIR